MSSRVQVSDISKQNIVSASALFGAGVVLLAGSLAAALAAGPAEAKPRPYYSYAKPAKSYAAPAKALGDRVAQASQSYSAYQGAAARPAPASATPYTDAYAAARTASKLAPTMVFFSAPVRGFSINSRFGLRKLSSRGAARPHEGVDFAAPTGSPVLCAAQGRVLRTGNSSTYGRFVEVEHPNGVTSFYAHLSAVNVHSGASLDAGDMLGKVGSTGRSTGPHLHFEIRRNGQQVDPAGFLGRQFPARDFQVYKIAHASGGMPANMRGVVAAE